MENVKFENLQLYPEILKAVKYMGFEEASPIQAQAIPIIIEGKILSGRRRPVQERPLHSEFPFCRKSIQKKEAPEHCVVSNKRTGYSGCRGNPQSGEIYAWNQGASGIWRAGDCKADSLPEKRSADYRRNTRACDDHMRRKTVKMDQIHTVVLDEADEMLNMGFRDDIETILKGVPEERQTILFSATMPKAIMEITKKFQKNAKVIKVTKRELTVPNIEQFYYEVKPKNKEEVLTRLLDIYTPKLSVIFCNTKKQVDLLVTALLGRGYFAGDFTVI